MIDDVTPSPARRPGLSADGAEQLADVMFALAAPSRLQILDCLLAGPRTVSEIVDEVQMEQSAVSHQLRVLREHGVLSVERRGRHRLYALRTTHVGEMLERAHAHLDALSARRRPAPRRRTG